MGGTAHVSFLNVTDDDPAELATFEAAIGMPLHPVARDHLLDSREHELTPFPRIENHGEYLFGMLFVPSDTGNTKADFDHIVFAISFEHVAISVAAHRSSTHDWDAIVPALGTQRSYSGDTAPGGRFLLELLDVVARTLSDDAVNLEQMVHRRTSDLGSGIDLTQSIEPGETEKLTSKSRRRIMETYREHGPILSAVRHEMPAMLGVVSETSGVLGSLVNDDDRVDIKQDSSTGRRELFSKELEIYLADIHIDTRNLIALLQSVDTSITATKEFMKQLNDDENVASNRFTGAIASIMLLPTFIVGLYGQNFDDMPETHWHFGYGFSWAAIVAVTLFQVWFFRRRKWL
ncbi:MAG: magnesium transporter CorA family protein [Actinomycetota bacterium]